MRIGNLTLHRTLRKRHLKDWCRIDRPAVATTEQGGNYNPGTPTVLGPYPCLVERSDAIAIEREVNNAVVNTRGVTIYFEHDVEVDASDDITLVGVNETYDVIDPGGYETDQQLKTVYALRRS